MGLTAAVVHARTMAFGYTGLDDRDLRVDDQAFLADPASLLRVFGRAYMHVVDAGHTYYRPLVTASFVVDAQWSGARPLGYHLTNVVLHVAASVLLWLLLRSLALGRGAVLGAALIFAVHPAFASVVAWIPGRNDSLLAVFGLASWIFFVRDRARPGWRDRAAHLGFFALALMTKETAFALPLVWTAQVAWLEGRRPERGTALAGSALGWVALVAARLALHPASPHAGIGDVVANLPQLGMGLGSIVIPLQPRVLAVAQDRSFVPGALAIVASAAALFFVFVRGSSRRLACFGLTAFGLLLAPSLLLPGTLILDSRLYLPSAGVLLALSGDSRRHRASHSPSSGGWSLRSPAWPSGHSRS